MATGTGSRGPSLAEIAYRSPLIVEQVFGEMGLAVVACPDCGCTAPLDDVSQLAVKRHSLRLAGFGVLGAQVGHIIRDIRPAQ
jgi:hypothetical protein